MTELNEQISTVSNPAEAVDSLVGEQFIEWMMEYIKNEMESWPAMNFLRTAEIKPEKIRKLMIQRFLAVQSLWGSEGDPGFLRFAIANLSESNDPEAEAPLEFLEKRLDEPTKPTSYFQTWHNVLKHLGATEEEITKTKPKDFTRNYIAELSDIYSTQEWQTALGALASQEWSLAYESRVWAEAIVRAGSTNKDLESLAAAADQKMLLEMGHLLDKTVFDPVSKQEVWNGASKQLDLKRQLLDELIHHFE